ncbi:ARL14 effector protein-like [Polypterus senegalus]|uniref:ARL14 effector protein-like n=1 Tax=Polypterus senegalus TaxID=55291 RepID=UPI001962B32B|nr:ARL14 effector protein-like [Polypterus senegalus]
MPLLYRKRNRGLKTIKTSNSTNGEESSVSYSQERKEVKPKQVDRELKWLQFQNPGPQLADFKPEKRVLSKRACCTKMRKIFRSSQMKYDEKGLLLPNREDLCDCLNRHCPGCFYPCPKCQSKKCGPECRCSRKWIYESFVSENDGKICAFP